ncbi:MAG TPA: hypothetical protein VFE53_12445 [Mucilaginibacter sp.]|jgi:hypothetical protein|nr:hypothetical protein [Mucilaginibacter sp.]
MKRIILLAVFTGFVTLVKAQSTEFHAFKWDIGFGYASPSQGSAVGGATFTLQPHYRFSNDFALGIRAEAAAILYKTSSGNKQGSAIASGCLTGEFYLSDKGFRPFIGAGVGPYDQATISGNNGNGSGSGNNNGGGVNISARVINFGAFPELGFEVGHLRVSVEYDATGGYNNYFAAKIGFFFGGGRKPPKK